MNANATCKEEGRKREGKREKRGGGRRAHGRELSTTLMQMQTREKG